MSSENDETRPLVYVAGALTGLSAEEADQYKERYEAAARVCEEFGFDPYVPHKYTDPVQHPLVSPHEVYQTDTGKVKEACWVLAFTEPPSHGVGTELAIAAEHETPVILMIRLGCPVSRMVLGNPAVIGVVSFSDKEWVKGERLLRHMIVKLYSVLGGPRHKTLNLERIEFTLPTTYNDGRPVPEEEFDTLEAFLSRRFTGWSYGRGRGGWASDDGTQYVEDHRLYCVYFPRNDFSVAESLLLRRTLQERFKQIQVLMVRTEAKGML